MQIQSNMLFAPAQEFSHPSPCLNCFVLANINASIDQSEYAYYVSLFIKRTLNKGQVITYGID